jgi:hypothetical protein
MSNQHHKAFPQSMASFLLLFLFLGIAGCGATSSGGSPHDNGNPSVQVDDDVATTVTGHVKVRGTGAPYPGAIVEFRNVYNAELHTTTDSSGAFSIALPAGVYNAFALDLNDMNAGFDVDDRIDSVVKVPPSTEINFVAYPIS